MRTPLTDTIHPPAATRGEPAELQGQSVAGHNWWHGWLPVIVLPVAVVVFVPATWPRWSLMWALAITIFCGCKWLTWRRTPVRGASLGRQLGYFVLWPGLDAASFLDPRPTPTPAKPALREWLFAGGKLALGVWLLYGVARQVPAEYPYLVGWVGLVGLAMVLHFGLFHLLSCFWRALGVQAPPLMNWPLAAVSVSDFWGRRWNTAFRDLTHRFLFRPLTAVLGPGRAVLAGFTFSGLVHDMVISVPAQGGYGGPSLFFLLQAVAILVERSRVGRWLGLGAGWRGWLFTMGVLLAPLTFLFHRPFVTEIIVPFMRAVGALACQ